MKFKIQFAAMLVASSCVSYSANAADDCYNGFKASSASQSCILNSAQFEPGSTNYCHINADCRYWISGTGQDAWKNNNGTWYVGDVRRLINNNGRLEIGNYPSNNEVKDQSDASID